jgi:hypothetical protein
MACGCNKNKVSVAKVAGEVEPFQFVAFTGKRVGAVSYSAEGTRQYMFGNTPYAQQNRVRVVDFPKLKEKYGNQLMVIPGDLASVFMTLGEPVGDVGALAPYAMQLEDLEIETVGEVIASPKGDFIPIFGEETDAIYDMLRLRVGLEVQYA